MGQQFQQKSSHFSAVTSGPRKSTKVGVPWRAQHLGMNWWEINILGHYPELQDNLQGNHSFQYWSLAKLLDWQKRRDQRCSKTQIATFWPQMVPGGQCPSTFRVETLAQSDPSCLVFFKEFALGPSFRYAPNHKRRIIYNINIHSLSQLMTRELTKGRIKKHKKQVSCTSIDCWHCKLCIEVQKEEWLSSNICSKTIGRPRALPWRTSCYVSLQTHLCDSNPSWAKAVLLKWRIRHHRYLLWRLEQLWRKHAYGLHAWCDFTPKLPTFNFERSWEIGL